MKNYIKNTEGKGCALGNAQGCSTGYRPRMLVPKREASPSPSWRSGGADSPLALLDWGLAKEPSSKALTPISWYDAPTLTRKCESGWSAWIVRICARFCCFAVLQRDSYQFPFFFWGGAHLSLFSHLYERLQQFLFERELVKRHKLVRERPNPPHLFCSFYPILFCVLLFTLFYLSYSVFPFCSSNSWRGKRQVQR